MPIRQKHRKQKIWEENREHELYESEVKLKLQDRDELGAQESLVEQNDSMSDDYDYGHTQEEEEEEKEQTQGYEEKNGSSKDHEYNPNNRQSVQKVINWDIMIFNRYFSQKIPLFKRRKTLKILLKRIKIKIRVMKGGLSSNRMILNSQIMKELSISLMPNLVY